MKTNSPIFCGQIAEQYFNILADQFFCFYSRFFRTNIKKAQMIKRSSRANFARRSADDKVVKPFINTSALRSSDDLGSKEKFFCTNDAAHDSIYTRPENLQKNQERPTKDSSAQKN